MKNVFLIGFMGCGKSSVAKYLANAYGMQVVEMDEVLEEQAGMSIPTIFERYGETHFRDMETELVSAIQTQEGKVVSCGGGVVLRRQNVEMMKQSGAIIWLTASPETILQRVAHDENRPLLKGKKNVSDIRALMENRRAMYESASEFVVHTDGKTIADIGEEIIAYMK